MEETAVVKRMVITFKKVGQSGDIQVDKVQVQGSGQPEDIDPVAGGPTGYTIGRLIKYQHSPICITFEMGGSYYEICFEP